MNVPIFFYLTDIVILFVGIPQGQSTFLLYPVSLSGVYLIFGLSPLKSI